MYGVTALPQMAKQYSDDQREQARLSYVEGSESLAAIASRLGIGQRTLEKWSAEGGWPGQKQGSKVLSFAAAQQAKAERPERPPLEDIKMTDPLGTQKALEETIQLLRQRLANPHDSRSAGSIAASLVKAIESYEKLVDPSIIIGRLIQKYVSPQEFAAAARERGWGR